MLQFIVGLITLLLFGFQALPAGADLYSWTDENGVKHFSNEPPPNVQDTKRQSEHKQDDGLSRKLDEDRERRQAEMTGKVPVGSDRRVTKNPGKVIFYTSDKCGQCNKGRRFFKEFKIPFTEYNIDKDEEAKARLILLRGKAKAPVLFIGGRRYNFFDYGIISGRFGIKEKNRARIISKPAK